MSQAAIYIPVTFKRILKIEKSQWRREENGNPYTLVPIAAEAWLERRGGVSPLNSGVAHVSSSVKNQHDFIINKPRSADGPKA